MGKPERNRLLGKPTPRWEDNSKMDLQEMEWGSWTGLIWLGIAAGLRALVKTVMTCPAP